jgi:hypothetical protein
MSMGGLPRAGLRINGLGNSARWKYFNACVRLRATKIIVNEPTETPPLAH